jgi:hypothetical protein
MKQRIVLLAALALATVASAAGYYLPGTYPQEFFIGQQLQGKHEHDLPNHLHTLDVLPGSRASGHHTAYVLACMSGSASCLDWSCQG